jgi:eukaryotic-like serine/threonine-protein kinase
MNINGYKVLKTLGSGNFGTTYLVEKENSKFALKLIRANMLDMGENDARRIEREIRILKSVNSNRVSKYIDDGFFQDGEEKYRFIVMEYVNGINLEKYLKENKSLSIEVSSKLTLNILKSVNDIHQSGIIHRDLKPSNIILTNSDTFEVKILDFGISKLIDASTLTTTGEGMGTFAYMAPEQLKSAKDIDFRADYYSVGAMLYEFLSGEKPLKMSNQLEAIYKIINEHPEPIINKVSNIPIELSRIIETLLSKEPYQRNLTYQEIATILKNCVKRKVAQKTGFSYKSSSLEFIPITQNNDSKVISKLIEEQEFDGAVFNAPQLIFSDKNYREIRKKNFRLLIDPYTHTLGYSAFTSKNTYKKLPYVINTIKKETPKDFRMTMAIQKRAKECIDFQSLYNPDIYISPYHFYNSVNSDWINVDLNVYNESRAYLESKGLNKPIYYGISLDIEKYEDVDDIESLVNLITSAQPHGYYLQIAGDFDSLNSNHYFSYAYLVKLLSYTNKEIIISRINDFSLGLTALGVNTIATSLGQGDSFKEDFLNRQESGGSPRRYYIERLMGLYNKNILTDIFSTSVGRELICNCEYCEASQNIDKLLEFNNCIQHHYITKKRQIDSYSVLSNQERVRKFLDSIEQAKWYIKEINKEKKIKGLNYKHLEVWKEVILEVSKIEPPQSVGF